MQPQEQPSQLSFKTRIVDSVPKRKKHSAQNLLNTIKATNNISWNELGEIKVNDQTVSKSNIQDLVNDVLHARKDFNPKGWEVFAQGF